MCVYMYIYEANVANKMTDTCVMIEANVATYDKRISPKHFLNSVRDIISAYAFLMYVYMCDARGEVRQPHETGESRPFFEFHIHDILPAYVSLIRVYTCATLEAKFANPKTQASLAHFLNFIHYILSAYVSLICVYTRAMLEAKFANPMAQANLIQTLFDFNM